jgi:sugar phosphate isomerase/epimerase
VAFTPVGAGQSDYKAVFAGTKQAGFKHFCVEQDNAASWGDSLAAVRVSYDALAKMLGRNRRNSRKPIFPAEKSDGVNHV